MSRPLRLVADSGPVLVLATIAAAGSFAHIHDTATEHGQGGWLSWAVAVCIDLTCVMAARERQRDKHTGRITGRLSWPTVVLTGGILLSIAANLAQAEATAWGWVTAATPAGAFLVAVSMLERRATATHEPALGPPPSWGRPPADGPKAVPSPSVPALDQTQDEPTPLFPHDPETVSSAPAPELLDFARRVAQEHQDRHGRPITRDALRARLGVSNQLASDLLRELRTQPA
jgi:hypothetical protein